MPVYEYEHLDEDGCPLGETRFAALQGLEEDALRFCPWCGQDVRRVVSRASFRTRSKFSAAKAAQRGMTTWRRVRRGEWEKVDGPGVDAIVGSPEDLNEEGGP